MKQSKGIRKLIAMLLAAAMCISLFASAAFAADEVDIETPAGAEAAEVTITVTESEEDGQVITETQISTPDGGVVTEEGFTVEFYSEVTEVTVENADGSKTVLESQESESYSIESSDGVYSEEGGREAESRVVDSDEEVVVDLIKDGEVQQEASATAGASSAAVPTAQGDATQAQDPDNFDQITESSTGRTVEAAVNAEITTDVVEDDEVLTADETTYNWRHQGVKSRAANGTWYAVKYDENGEPVKDENGEIVKTVVDVTQVRERTAKNTEGKVIDGLYCVDASTTIKPYFDYRIVNLEDAVEENYYSVEDAAHLRGIMLNSYTGKGDAAADDKALAELKAQLREAQANGDENLQGLDIDALTKSDAATSTGFAIWYYANRFAVAEDERLELELSYGLEVDLGVSEDQFYNKMTEEERQQLIEAKRPEFEAAIARREKLYNYLLTLTEEAPEEEKQIINSEKFIKDMSITVGSKSEGEAANEDTDTSNDVYDVEFAFSLVVTPDKDNDDLIVKVVDGSGTVVKEARIAGQNAEDEKYEYAQPDANGNYVLSGMKLAENSNASFNIKLEGTQQLKEGVYVFQAEHFDDEAAAKELKSLFGKRYSDQMYQEMGADPYYQDSQNLIGKFSETTAVNVSMQIDLTFNVEEATVTTEHSWRSVDIAQYDVQPISDDPTPTTPPFDPVTPTEPTDIPDAEVPLSETPEADEDFTEIKDDEVPLTDIPDEDVPKTGAESSIALVIFALSGLALLGMALVEKSRRVSL